jgi:hypothetical protein
MSNKTKKTAIDEFEQVAIAQVWTWRRLLTALVITAGIFAISYGVYSKHPIVAIAFMALITGTAVVMDVSVIQKKNQILGMVKPLYNDAYLYRMRWEEAEETIAIKDESRNEWRSVVLDRCTSPDDPETVGAHLAQVDGKDRALEAANKALHARHNEDCETVRMLWEHTPQAVREHVRPMLSRTWSLTLDEEPGDAGMDVVEP